MQRIEELYDKYLNDSISETEKQELFELIRQSDDSRLAELAHQHLHRPEPEDLDHLQADTDRILQQIKQRIAGQEESRETSVKSFPLWRWATIAASALIIGFAGYYIYDLQTTLTKQPLLTTIHGDDVAPGGNRATVTLSDGTVVELDKDKSGIVINENEFTYADGEQVITSTALQYATLATPRGGQYQLTLPDGSKVWLNAATSLTYPTRFEGAQRIVKLQGEAFFDIAKDQTKPFIVESNGQQITVTGTTFNVEAYESEESTSTTLVSGSVRINSKSGHSVALRPGQKAILRNNGLKTTPADIHAVTGWVRGEFVFHYSTLADILPQLERWYNIEADIPAIPQEEFYAEISRHMPLSAVLKAMEETSNLRFEIKERRLLLKKR